MTNKHLSRREMLKQLGVMIGVAAVPPIASRAQARTQGLAGVGNALVTLTPAEAETLRAIIARIIPADENGPGALEARSFRGGHLPVGLETTKMVDANDVVQPEDSSETLDPPAVATALDQTPVVDGVAPQLSGSAEVIRRHTCYFCGVPLWFEENLLPLLFGKLDYLIFDGRAIPRPNTFNYARIHRRLVKICADDFCCFFRREGNMTRQLAV